MAVPSDPEWQRQVLSGVNAPVTPENMRVLDAWSKAEGGGAMNNPFNTTQPMGGATPYNMVSPGTHVYNYSTPQQGVQATIRTLNNGYYQNIVSALRQGRDAHAVARAIANSPWGTGRSVLDILNANPVTASSLVPIIGQLSRQTSPAYGASF